MDCSWEQLIALLAQTELRWNVTRTSDGGCYKANIKGNGTMLYEVGSANSAKSALCLALAEFLISEKKDIHDY